MFVYRGIALLLGLVLSGSATAFDIERTRTCAGVVLRLQGDVLNGDFARLKYQFRGTEPIVGLEISSDGGILEEGLRIADLTRRKKLTVYVSAKCDSVCAVVFFAAAKRYLRAGAKIGVHSVSNDRDIEDAGSTLLTIKIARLWAREGVPISAIGKMVTTAPQQITYLDPNDLAGLSALEGNPFVDTNEETSQHKQTGCSARSKVMPTANADQ
ncbi:hypothetical protein ACRQ5Q_42610 (plasmid) [Bradyrhizobium sp. PMVTL-01]|uniref:hypothetical protein n=1 Tax=Bradyrhizobium sp. PMVTL-01 TaxID=3434999 RepID=UPI003F6E8E88